MKRIELLNVRLSKLSKLNWAQQIIFSPLSLLMRPFYNISFHSTTYTTTKPSEKGREGYSNKGITHIWASHGKDVKALFTVTKKVNANKNLVLNQN